MFIELDFTETDNKIILTFYKSPKIRNRPEFINPKIYLKDNTTLIFNTEEIKLFAPVKEKTLDEAVIVTDYKIEITLTKEKNQKWNRIDGGDCSYVCNGYAYEDEEKDDKTMFGLFNNLYEKGDDDTRRAMIKSLEESNGTVLNTNWADVKSKKVNPEN